MQAIALELWGLSLIHICFLGRGAEALGIAEHEAHVRELERLFGHGADPRTGGPLGRGFDPDNERAVAGFALTFSPPKSVSALWAVGDQPMADQVLAAHDAAVAASLAFLEEHAACLLYTSRCV